MKVIDFKITGGAGTLSDSERRAGMRAAQAAINAGADHEAAELAACTAAFEGWAREPEAVELVVE